MSNAFGELKEASKDLSSLAGQLPSSIGHSEQTVETLRDTLVRIEEGQQALLKIIDMSEKFNSRLMLVCYSMEPKRLAI